MLHDVDVGQKMKHLNAWAMSDLCRQLDDPTSFLDFCRNSVVEDL
jgi:hypothetical protein